MTMPSGKRKGAKLSFRLSSDLVAIIEEAAAARGQSMHDFVVATLVEAARAVLRRRNVTELTNRDRDIFLTLLDDAAAKPSQALTEAAERYKKHFCT
jgi:uncharacterized protein (DUF1778 family)